MKTIVALLLFAGAMAVAQAFHQAVPMRLRKPSGGERIIQGSPAVNGQFPHQAFLITSDSSGNRYGCGGSLISNIWILTAAHCVEGVSIQVHLGHVAYASSPVIQRASSFVMHPNYNPDNNNNDIALVRLSTAVQQTNNIKVIPFARNPSVTFEGVSATVSGFGFTVTDGHVSPTLNYVGVRVIPNNQCAPQYLPGIIIESTICIVGGATSAQGTCSGDSGGPLIANVNGVTTLIGIVSFGTDLCGSGVPDGLIRPSHFVSWISSHTGL